MPRLVPPWLLMMAIVWPFIVAFMSITLMALGRECHDIDFYLFLIIAALGIPVIFVGGGERLADPQLKTHQRLAVLGASVVGYVIIYAAAFWLLVAGCMTVGGGDG